MKYLLLLFKIRIRKWHFLKKLKANFDSSNKIFLIYTMGKVGSTSILRMLRSHLPQANIYHVHRLNKQYLQNRKKELKNSRTSFEKEPHLWTGLLWKPLWIRENIVEKRRNFTTITLVRDPVKRNESLFFQHMNIARKHGGGFYCSSRNPNFPYQLQLNSGEVYPLIDVYLNKFPHFMHEDWLASEFEQILGISIHNMVLSNDQKYWYIAEKNLLIIKLEYLDEVINEVFDLIGIGEIEKRQFTSNVTSDKGYYSIYKDFQKQIIYPASLVDRIYNSAYIKKFYSHSEIDYFKDRINIQNK